jgi:Transposase DDE domain
VDFTALFVEVDDFWLAFRHDYERQLLSDGHRRRRRETSLSLSEIMTILIAFQTSHFRTFKHYYAYLLQHHRGDFPGLVSYCRFITWMPRATVPLFAYLMSRCRGVITGINFIDSTALKVCGNKRITRHRVFDGIAAIGKNTMGWFHGFKLHLVINDRGELLAFALTAGNVDDRTPVPTMTHELWGKLFGDKGYISQALFEQLYVRGLQLITSIRDNMANKLTPLEDKILLRKRSLIETVNDQLKNVCQIEHTRHRSPHNFLVHLLAGLIAYAHQPKKPSLKINVTGDPLMLAAA